jgi:hypothetical protein
MSAATADGELVLLILSNGMPFADLASTLDKLKEDSKSIGAHKRRELFWQAYTKLISRTSSMEGGAHCFMLYRVKAEDGEGSVEVVEMTKRQRGLVGGGCEILGHKFKPPDDPTSKWWVMAFVEEEAPRAWEDLMSAEACVCVRPDGVYTATRFKRALCKGLSAPLKTVKEVQALVAELAPDKPLKNVSFVANEPPTTNDYNCFLAGPWKLDSELPPTIGHVAATGAGEMYEYFVSRKNGHVVGEAGRLIQQMLADQGKGLTAQISVGSQKEVQSDRTAPQTRVAA